MFIWRVFDFEIRLVLEGPYVYTRQHPTTALILAQTLKIHSAHDQILIQAAMQRTFSTWPFLLLCEL